MNTVSVAGLLPVSPLTGPPLPKVLNITWQSFLSLLTGAPAPAAVAAPAAAVTPAGTRRVTPAYPAAAPAAAVAAAAPAAEAAPTPTKTPELTSITVTTPAVYAAKCPPLLFKVSYRDPTTGQWTSKTVLAVDDASAAAALGLKAGVNCQVSSQSGTQASLTYHTTGQLPARTVVASAEQVAAAQAAAAQAKATTQAQEAVRAQATATYRSYSTADRIAVSLIYNPPARSLTVAEKERIATFQAKSAAEQAAVTSAYQAYKAAGGTG